jgi:hypothetical protein
MNEFDWWTPKVEVPQTMVEAPILKKLLNLTYAAAVLESLGPEASHMAGGVWGLVNPVLDELGEQFSEEEVVRLAAGVILLSPSNDPREQWLDDWGRTNGWELLFRVQDVEALERLFEVEPRIVEAVRENILYGGYSAFASGIEEGARPEPYLGFIASAVILRCDGRYDSTVKLRDLVLNQLRSDKVFADSMIRISGWQDAQKPARVVKEAMESL